MYCASWLKQSIKRTCFPKGGVFPGVQAEVQWMLALVLAVLIVATLPTNGQNGLTQSNEFMYGRVRTDGTEYSTFDVLPGTAQAVLTFARSSLHYGVAPVILLKHGALPTTEAYDVRFNGTLDSYWLTERIPNLRIGRYYVAVWGGALESSIVDFGIGPSANVWYHLVVQFTSCVDPSRIGFDCAYLPLPIAAPVPSADLVNSVQLAGAEVSTMTGCFDPDQYIALYTFTTTVETAFNVSLRLSKPPASPNAFFWALYHDRANPFDISTTAYASGQGVVRTTDYLMKVSTPPSGSWILLVFVDVADAAYCASSQGTKFSLSYAPMLCDGSGTMVDACDTTWTPMDELLTDPTRATSALDRWFLVSEPTVIPPTATTSQQYAMTLSPDMAGANVAVQLIVPATTSVADLVLLVGVDRYPTETRYNYRFNGTKGVVTTGIRPEVSIAMTVNGDTIGDVVAVTQPNGSMTVVWPPVRFPAIGTWYIAVLSPLMKFDLRSGVVLIAPSRLPTQTLVVQTTGCSANMCGPFGACLLKNTYQGLTYYACVCKYGYSGPFCATTDAVKELWHGWFLVLSNFAVVPSTVAAAKQSLHVEATMFAALGVASSLYHACDLNWFCVMPFSYLMRFDFGFSFNCIFLCLVHLSGVHPRSKIVAQVVGAVVLIVLLAINPTAPVNLIVVGSLGAAHLLLAWTGYFVIAAERMRWRVSMLRIFELFLLRSDNFNLRALTGGILLWLGALLCWFFNSSPAYWLLHSLWHIFAMTAAGAFIVSRRSTSYRLLDNNGIDMLQALPKDKNPVRRVLVVPADDLDAGPSSKTCDDLMFEP
ncbi:hypothetical protein ACHHYP_07469 [Achlya hypogyna]|uniref:EGF-like domain-containing protein n=1 Tax=Achlya hypogyna TaxID=1202772 RepID=A0A1V9ZM98_ACHHY|nr:hypothetical protein ACHHYP_07469 [Achlya hypogyna]